MNAEISSNMQLTKVLYCFFITIFIVKSQEFSLNELKAISECVDDTDVVGGFLFQMSDGVFLQEPKLSEFLFCYYKKLGYMNDKGEYLIEVMRKILEEAFGEDFADDVIDECCKRHGDGPEAAYALAKCYHNKVLQENS